MTQIPNPNNGKMKLPINYDKAKWWERKAARNQYILLQDGACYLCGAQLDCDPAEEINECQINWRLFPDGFLRYPVHLHHSHITGMTLGAVHAKCNAYLWQYKGE